MMALQRQHLSQLCFRATTMCDRTQSQVFSLEGSFDQLCFTRALDEDSSAEWILESHRNEAMKAQFI